MILQLELPGRLDSAATARHAVEQLSSRLPDDVLGDVRLLVSELVTNALRHSGLRAEDRIRLAVRLEADRVRVEVTDPGNGFSPDVVPGDPMRAEGWGLYLVSTLADRWGVEARERGGRETRVWFELDRGPGRSAGVAA